MKLLLIRNDNIGDLACTTPLLQLLREAYPDGTIDILGNSYNVDLLRYDPRVSSLWSYDKAKHFHSLWQKVKAWISKIILLGKLRLQHYDAIIIAVPLFNRRTVQLAKWIKPMVIYGAPSRQDPIPKNYYPVLINDKEPHALQVTTYARALGIQEPTPDCMTLYLSEEEKRAALIEKTAFSGDALHPVIGLQISARRPKQRWSLEQWKEFITHLHTFLPSARFRLLWSPGSKDNLQHPGDDLLASQLKASFPLELLLAKPTNNLRSLMVTFSSCDLIVGSDGGAMHIAAGLGIPTLTLFGDIDPTIWRPFSKKGHEMLSPSGSLRDLAPEKVAKQVALLLSSTR